MTDPAALAVARAEALIDLNRPAEAVGLLHAALATEPEDARIWCALAAAHLRAGEPEWAVGAAERGAGYGSGDPGWPHRLRCLGLHALGRGPEAVAAARLAVTLDPNGWRNHNVLADVLMNYPHLVDPVERPITAPYDWTPPPFGTSLADRRYRREAEEIILATALRAAELAPDEADVHLTLAWAHVRRREWNAARAATARALEIAPDDARVHSECARMLNRRGRLAEAAGGFGRAAAIDPTGRASAEFAAVCRRAVQRGILAAVVAWLVLDLVLDAVIGEVDRPGWAVAVSTLVMVLALLAPATLTFVRLGPGQRHSALRVVRRDRVLQLRFGALLGLVLVGVVIALTDALDTPATAPVSAEPEAESLAALLGLGFAVLIGLALFAKPVARLVDDLLASFRTWRRRRG